MFTGIIEKKSKIIKIENGRFTISHDFIDLQIGQSIAHDGACMTIEDFDDSSYTFFVMLESLSKTNFGKKKQGDFFNVERCLKVGDRIDGHFVSGHIDSVGKIVSIRKLEDSSNILTVEFFKSFSNNLVEKGSVCINGVSLTVVEKGTGYFTVSIIPHTWNVTNLGDLKEGMSVNLEFDMLGKYILNTKNNV